MCPCARLMLAWVYVRGAHKASVSLCVRKGGDAFMAVSDLSTSQFDRAREPGGRERD